MPRPPVLVRTPEIAVMLGVTDRRAVAQWRKNDPEFPQPYRRVGKANEYRKTEILAWAKRRGRKVVV